MIKAKSILSKISVCGLALLLALGIATSASSINNANAAKRHVKITRHAKVNHRNIRKIKRNRRHISKKHARKSIKKHVKKVKKSRKHNRKSVYAHKKYRKSVTNKNHNLLKKHALLAYRILRKKGFSNNQAKAGVAVAFHESNGKLILPKKYNHFVHSYFGRIMINHYIRKAKHIKGSENSTYRRACKMLNIKDRNVNKTIKRSNQLL